MLITWLSIAALSFNSPLTIARAPGGGGGHGKVAWFQGSYEEALAEAKASKKLVFIDFWTTWCGWCKRLDKDTFSNAEVAEAMKGFVCMSVDAESTLGRPIAARFAIQGFPALFFLSADGSIEDMISGYKGPADFKREVERILAGTNTVGSLRREVDADASNIEKRWKLVQKLESVGDKAAREAQMAEIKKLDPAGKSLPMRRLAFEAVIAKINAGFQRDRSLDLEAVESFLAEERHPVMLFQGHYALSKMHEYLAQEATGKGDLAGAKKHASAGRGALRAAWENVPEDQIASFGNSLANAYYEAREDLSAAEKTFALEVAEKAATAAEAKSSTGDEAREAYVHALDTYACCLFMNGKKDAALKQIERGKALAPDADVWKDRLAEFQK
jgi:thiol-disulfide isomerase/thioredoxin